MERCTRFNICNAPLCPLDSDIKDRVWWADEEVCRSRKYGQHRWIRKQRSIQRRETKSWIDKPITYEMLIDASWPRKPMTKEQRTANIAVLVKARANESASVTL